jgi:predicted enzyme related to lactoylglutathione lyase
MAQAVGKKEQAAFFTGTFSSFAVDDIDEARKFYGDKLGVSVADTEQGGLQLEFEDGAIFIYPKDDHEPATFTVLNFAVDDIDTAVKELKGRGIEFESYDGEIATDDDNIFRGADSGTGPNIAWFKDPAGNFLSVIES